jgi:hypothetical protein
MSHPPLCGQPVCRAYQLTVAEFERLGGEPWTQGFRVRVGLLAKKLYVEIYGNGPRKVRSTTKPGWRNKVGKYPCGVLEQAYEALKDAPLCDSVRTAFSRNAALSPLTPSSVSATSSRGPVQGLGATAFPPMPSVGSKLRTAVAGAWTLSLPSECGASGGLRWPSLTVPGKRQRKEERLCDDWSNRGHGLRPMRPNAPDAARP